MRSGNRHSFSWLVTILAVAALTMLGVGFGAAASADPGRGVAKDHGKSHGKADKDETPAKSGKPGKGTRGAKGDKGDKGGKGGHDNPWQAQSDPDGMENGGVDQPGGMGGTIGAQDGNNGSGNDIDCEDDNRGKGVPGHCKDKPGSCEAAPGNGNGKAKGHAKKCDEVPVPVDEGSEVVDEDEVVVPTVPTEPTPGESAEEGV